MKGQREPACDSRSGIRVDRRTFMGTMACAGAGTSLGALAQPTPPATAPVKAQRAMIAPYVNGVAHELDLEPRVTLLDGTNLLDLMKGDVEQPVNSDFADIDITFVDENDQNFNPLGARHWRIGIAGVAAAITNAVYHATGKRVRDLPMTPDKLLDAYR
jgi:hypothetical protein